MFCERPVISVRVPACGSVSSTIVATENGTHTFNYTYLDRDYCKPIEGFAGNAILIQGEWFNEGAKTIGTITAPSGVVMSDTSGVSEISITVVKVVK